MLNANAMLANGTTAIQAARHMTVGEELMAGLGWDRIVSTVNVVRTSDLPRQSKNGIKRISEIGTRELGMSEEMEMRRVRK
jgi:hypothetical protein